MNQPVSLDVLTKMNPQKSKYPLDGLPPQAKREAYKFACDTRKFEIELYWKRATYFWGFIIIAFSGYGVSLEAFGFGHEYTFSISLIGLVFSLCWYYVNRASKFWQINWETHIDKLEDEIAGPIYKSPLNPKDFPFHRLKGAYAYSVSGINQILSLFVSTIWIYNVFRNMSEFLDLREWFHNMNHWMLFVICLGFLVYISFFCKTNFKDTVERSFYAR